MKRLFIALLSLAALTFTACNIDLNARLREREE